MDFIDADWAPAAEGWESPTKIADPARYIRRCAARSYCRSRRMDRLACRCLTSSLGLLAFVAVLALLVG